PGLQPVFGSGDRPGFFDDDLFLYLFLDAQRRADRHLRRRQSWFGRHRGAAGALFLTTQQTARNHPTVRRRPDYFVRADGAALAWRLSAQRRARTLPAFAEL